VLAEWHQERGLTAWTRAALDAASAQIEDEMSAQPVVEGKTAGRQDTLLRDGAQALGLEGRFIHRYERGCRGSGRCLHGCPNDAKQSTTINYLRRAVADGATVVANAQVRRVIFDGERAVGVSGRGFRVRARRGVIVAASAVQSPNLLRRSGVRLPALGEGFMAHPGTTVMGRYPSEVNAWRGASQGYEVLGLRNTLGVKLESINVPPEVVSGDPNMTPTFSRSWLMKNAVVLLWLR